MQCCTLSYYNTHAFEFLTRYFIFRMFDDIDWIESGQRVKTSGVGQKFRSSSVFGR